MRVLGIDPGLTRCGMGVVEGSVGRPLTLVDVNVIRTSADLPIAERLVTIEKGVDAWLDEHRPDAGCRSPSTPRVRSRPRSPGAAVPARPRSGRW